MLLRSTLRTIRRSLGRYLAILSIIALGVGFFAGLRVTRDAMLKTADRYLNELRLYDLRLISTLGLTQEDLAAFQALEGVEKAVGSVSADLVVRQKDGSDAVLHAHSLLDGVNGVDLVQGRMPENDGECLFDALYATEETLNSTLVLSQSNTDETLERFTHDAYKVVGLVNASEYIQFQRGTTSLPGGRVSGYIYLLPGGFSTDYYTEIYLTLPGSHALYSEAYETAVDALQAPAETLLQERAELRHQNLYDEARQKLDDAKAELEDKRSELASARQELDDGWQTYRAEKEDAERRLAEAKKKLDDARAEIDKNRRLLNEAKADPTALFADAQQELSEKEAELAQAEAEYQAGLSEYETAASKAQAELSAAEQKLKDAQAAIDPKWEEYRREKTVAELGLSGLKALLDRAESELEERRTELEDAKNSPLAATPAVQTLIASLERALQRAEEAYQSARSDYEKAADRAEAELSDAEQQLSAAQAEIDKGREQFLAEQSAAEAKLAEPKRRLDAARAELDNGKTAIEQGKRDLAAALEEIGQELVRQEAALNQAEKDWQSGLSEYEDAERQAQQELSEAEQKLTDGETDLAEGEGKLRSAEREIADGERELIKLENPSVYVLDRRSNYGYAVFENDIQIVTGVARVFPVFFFLVAALVCITTMTRMVGEQRTQNGVLKALGYGNLAVASQYLLYAGSASVLGCVFGFLLGSRLMPLVLWRVYRILYAIDRPIAFVLDGMLFAVCTTLYLLCMLGVTWFVCRTDLRSSAATLMRPLSPASGKRVFLERIGFLWKPMKFLHKVSARNILRYKKRMVMMIIGVGGCTALLLTGYGIRDTIRPILSRQFGEISLYDATVSFLTAPDAREQADFLAECEAICSAAAVVHTERMDLLGGKNTVKPVDTVVFGADMSPFLSLHRGEEPVAFPGRGELVLNNGIADKLNLSVGDRVTLRDSDYRTLTLTLSGIFDNYIGNVACFTAESYTDALGYAPQINTAYLNFRRDGDTHEAGAEILGMENVASLEIIRDRMETVSGMLDSLNLIVVIVLVSAGALAFIVLYNLTNITITERAREIATLKVLGFHPVELRSYVFRESLILTVISSVCGVPFGHLLLAYTMSQIQIDGFFFGRILAPTSYLWSFLLTVLFTVIVDLALDRKLRRVNMAEAMKAVE